MKVVVKWNDFGLFGDFGITLTDKQTLVVVESLLRLKKILLENIKRGQGRIVIEDLGHEN